MADIKKRVYTLDNDTVEVTFVFDAETGMHFGKFPDFSETPKFTARGCPWVNVTNEDCPYAEKEYGDCGSCKYFRCEHPGDLIGICENENMRKGNDYEKLKESS